MRAMRPFGILVLAAALVAPQAHAEEDAAFGHALTLMQVLVRAAAQAPGDPTAGLRAFDEVLSGRNPEASEALSGLFEEMTTGMPAQHKDRLAMIGRDLAGLARLEAARPPAVPAASVERALQARKELTAMGLTYHDEAQYLAAVKRNDALAVELYLLGRGVNPAATDAFGRSALDLARANRNPQLAELISRNLPAAR